MVLLGWIHHQCLTFKGRSLFPIENRDHFVPFPSCHRPLLRWWLVQLVLASPVLWKLLPPFSSSRQMPPRMGGVSRCHWACKPRVSGLRPIFAISLASGNFWFLSSFCRSFLAFGTWKSVSAWTTGQQFGASNIRIPLVWRFYLQHRRLSST